MAKALYEEFDDAVSELMAGGNPRVGRDLAEVVEIGRQLKMIPRVEFKERLGLELEVAAGQIGVPVFARAVVLPMPRPMFAAGPATYPVSRKNFVLSFAAHAAALAFIVSSGLWVVSNKQEIQKTVVTLVDPGTYVLTVSPKESGGGGGGGDRDKVPAPQGKLPKQAVQQITPPAVVLRNDHPMLAVEPAVVASPLVAINLPNLGDPASRVTGPPSNGSGSEGGIGSGSGGGVGIGTGPGVGPGVGGGIGGGCTGSGVE